MPAQSPALAFEGVSKHYRDTRAVDGVTLAIAGGSFVALVGTSGPGKSTLLKTVNRLVEPSAGRVTIDGEDVASGPAPALRRRIGYVFQSIGLFPHLSVGENIGIGPRLAGDAPADVGKLLDLVELPRDLARRMPDELSGGQRQRVAIARALATDPDLVVLDEAVSALDVSVQAQILDLLVELQQQLEVSYLFISHDLAVVREISDRVAVMQKGRVVEQGPTATVLTYPREEYTRRLIDAIPGRAREAVA